LFLDTRTKIVPRQDIEKQLPGGCAVWVSGHFDPLLAEHVRKLARVREPGRPLVVEVTNPMPGSHPQALLAQRARAELVAALSMVDFVVLGGAESAADSGITERFIELVLDRHRQETR
jgi:glycerol-3-phosphate cytidylyltransferase-like family protein